MFAFVKLYPPLFLYIYSHKLKSLLSSYGLIDINPIRKVLVKLYECDPTFSELKKKIYVSAY